MLCDERLSQRTSLVHPGAEGRANFPNGSGATQEQHNHPAIVSICRNCIRIEAIRFRVPACIMGCPRIDVKCWKSITGGRHTQSVLPTLDCNLVLAVVIRTRAITSSFSFPSCPIRKPFQSKFHISSDKILLRLMHRPKLSK